MFIMTVEIPDHVLEQAGLSSNELLLKVAMLLFEEEKLTLGQASRLAGMHQSEFQREIAAAGIPVHYGEEDLERDLATLGLKE
jgi:predicted HTH domain antitoxin